MKKTILHFIYSLGRGGAETMLVKVLQHLPEYRNIVVTLQDNNHFAGELKCDEYICINKPSFKAMPAAAVQFKKIIKKYQPDIIHSHLPQCNFIARLAVPNKLPLITTIHTSVATAIDYKKWYIRLIDKLTNRYKSSVIIAVSNVALKDYFMVLKVKPGKTFVLYTFVDVNEYKEQANICQGEKLKVISVGALRKGKNYAYLIEAFKQLKNQKIELHVYGIGPEEENLQKAIADADVPIVLMGQANNMPVILPKYDIFIMPSMFEGFSLSVLEAMAVQLPLLLSDIPSFREQCEDIAIYFNLNDVNDFVSKIKELATNRNQLYKMGQAARQRVINNFTLEHHMAGLRKIYADTLNN
jgi:glycosyltransferase involved in cell wall biosynthesis